VEEKVISLVTGNASWWKQSKYRSEAAEVLRQLRRDGWPCVSMKRVPARGIDTRCFHKSYSLRRPGSGSDRFHL
jgi:hypothetical protein